MARGISNDLSIDAFIHCTKCIDEIKSGAAGEVSPMNYARLNVGWTKLGFQVWCVRHEANVMHVDFEGHKHPANLNCPGPKQ